SGHGARCRVRLDADSDTCTVLRLGGRAYGYAMCSIAHAILAHHRRRLRLCSAVVPSGVGARLAEGLSPLPRAVSPATIDTPTREKSESWRRCRRGWCTKGTCSGNRLCPHAALPRSVPSGTRLQERLSNGRCGLVRCGRGR